MSKLLIASFVGTCATFVCAVLIFSGFVTMTPLLETAILYVAAGSFLVLVLVSFIQNQGVQTRNDGEYSQFMNY